MIGLYVFSALSALAAVGIIVVAVRERLARSIANRELAKFMARARYLRGY